MERKTKALLHVLKYPVFVILGIVMCINGIDIGVLVSLLSGFIFPFSMLYWCANSFVRGE